MTPAALTDERLAELIRMNFTEYPLEVQFDLDAALRELQSLRSHIAFQAAQLKLRDEQYAEFSEIEQHLRAQLATVQRELKWALEDRADYRRQLRNERGIGDWEDE